MNFFIFTTKAVGNLRVKRVKGTVLRRFFSSFAYVCFLNLLALNLTDVCKKLACSQTLYFLFKVRRARVIKN